MILLWGGGAAAASSGLCRFKKNCDFMEGGQFRTLLFPKTCDGMGGGQFRTLLFFRNSGAWPGRLCQNCKDL